MRILPALLLAAALAPTHAAEPGSGPLSEPYVLEGLTSSHLQWVFHEPTMVDRWLAPYPRDAAGELRSSCDDGDPECLGKFWSVGTRAVAVGHGLTNLTMAGVPYFVESSGEVAKYDLDAPMTGDRLYRASYALGQSRPVSEIPGVFGDTLRAQLNALGFPALQLRAMSTVQACAGVMGMAWALRDHRLAGGEDPFVIRRLAREVLALDLAHAEKSWSGWNLAQKCGVLGQSCEKQTRTMAQVFHAWFRLLKACGEHGVGGVQVGGDLRAGVQGPPSGQDLLGFPQ